MARKRRYKVGDRVEVIGPPNHRLLEQIAEVIEVFGKTHLRIRFSIGKFSNDQIFHVDYVKCRPNGLDVVFDWFGV
jgi:hypothetical protein